MNESDNSANTTNSLQASLKSASVTLDALRFPPLPICCWFFFWLVNHALCSLQIQRCCFRLEVPDLDAHEKIFWQWWQIYLSRLSLVLMKCSQTRDLGTIIFFTFCAWDVAFVSAHVFWYSCFSCCISTSVYWLLKDEDVICKKKKELVLALRLFN